MNNKFLIRVVFLALIAWYISVCLLHYVGQRPLWNDEVAVFSSIQVLKPAEFFTEPLRMVQVFPHVYLFLIQFFCGFFDNSILSLRFLPFVCMMAAFGLWQRIARKELTHPSEYLTFLLCWCASVPLIYYSAELKQYSMDVLVSALFVWFLYNQERLRSLNTGRYGIILTLLPLTVFFSYPAYFFLMLPLWNLCLDLKSDRMQGKYIAAYLISVCVCVAVSYQIDIRLRPVEIVTGGFGDYFIATDSLKNFFQTFGEGVNNLFSRWFVELPKIFRKTARIFMLFGFIYMFIGFFKNIQQRKGRFVSIPTIAFVVFLQLAIAGAMHKYPFGVPRTALFLCPMLLVLTVQGIRGARSINRYAYYAVHGAFLVFLIVVAVGILGLVVTRPLNAIPEIWTL